MNNIKALRDYLQCPSCDAQEFIFEENFIHCNGCSKVYPVIDRLPVFILPDMQKAVKKVQSTFEFKWRLCERESEKSVTIDNYVIDKQGRKNVMPVRLKPKDDTWIALTKKEFDISEDDVKDKTVLDVGAGFGRMAHVMNTMGARHIFSFDICRSGMDTALNDLADKENITFLQADIEQMPFRKESFDMVISWGVFHHTPNTEASFRKAARLVKPGGTFLVHLYETSDRRRIKYTNMLRAVIQKFPLRAQYFICRKFLTIYDWSVFDRKTLRGKIMLFLHKRIMFGNNPIGVFDCYSPRFNHTHSDEEVISWFRSEGFDNVQIVNNELWDPRFSTEDNKKLRRENGKHGGFLLIKGVKDARQHDIAQN